MNRSTAEKDPNKEIKLRESFYSDKPKNLILSLKEYLFQFLFKNKKHLTSLEKKHISLNERRGEDYWYYKFKNIHPDLNLDQAEPKKLRLILGIGRSGTTWIGRMLATSSTPLRYFEEPLHSINPALSFANVRSHTDISFYKDLPDAHRLLFAYKLLTLQNLDWDSLGLQRSLRKNDKNFNFCLVKEVHCLLATEALLNRLQVPSIIVMRNPLYIVDSLFDAQTLSSIYLVYQNKLILKDQVFFKRYFSKTNDEIHSTFSKIAGWPDERRKIVQQRILMVSLMTKMLEQVAKNSTMSFLIRYEDICRSPEKLFSDMAAFLGLDWKQNSIDSLMGTLNFAGEGNHYSVKRNTKKQLNRPFRFLTQEEIEEAKEMLKYCELNYLTSSQKV